MQTKIKSLDHGFSIWICHASGRFKVCRGGQWLGDSHRTMEDAKKYVLRQRAAQMRAARKEPLQPRDLFSPEETATILAALRCLQEAMAHHSGYAKALYAEYFAGIEPLDHDDIDALCEFINR